MPANATPSILSGITAVECDLRHNEHSSNQQNTTDESPARDHSHSHRLRDMFRSKHKQEKVDNATQNGVSADTATRMAALRGSSSGTNAGTSAADAANLEMANVYAYQFSIGDFL